MPRVTQNDHYSSNTKFLIAAGLFKLIAGSPALYDRLEYILRLEFEDQDDEHLAPVEM
jgi:hypothetical protein